MPIASLTIRGCMFLSTIPYWLRAFMERDGKAEACSSCWTFDAVRHSNAIGIIVTHVGSTSGLTLLDLGSSQVHLVLCCNSVLLPSWCIIALVMVLAVLDVVLDLVKKLMSQTTWISPGPSVQVGWPTWSGYQMLSKSRKLTATIWTSQKPMLTPVFRIRRLVMMGLMLKRPLLLNLVLTKTHNMSRHFLVLETCMEQVPHSWTISNPTSTLAIGARIYTTLFKQGQSGSLRLGCCDQAWVCSP